MWLITGRNGMPKTEARTARQGVVAVAASHKLKDARMTT